MKCLAAVLLVMLFSGTALAQDTPGALVQRMMKTSVFAFGGVGFIGRTSQGEIDFRTIQSLPATVALDDFEELYTDGDAEAKSYALVAIRQLDRTRFDVLLQSLQGSQQKVLTMQGCILEKRNRVDVARTISLGSYDGYLKSR